MTPTEIERLTRSELWEEGPFPYPDCRWLQRHAGAASDLVPDLDYYLRNVVGLGASASRLSERNSQEVAQAVLRLRRSFFDLFPAHKPLAERINETDTPKLARELRFAELIRTELLPLLESELSHKNRMSAEGATT